MSSKFGLFGCLTCGEFLRSTMIDSIEQFEMHMCCIENSDEKRQNLLKLREVLDAEIKKIPPTPMTAAKPAPPPPPPPPFFMSQPSLEMPQITPQGSLKAQLDQVTLKKVSSKQQNALAHVQTSVQNFNAIHKFGKENAPNMMNVHGQLQNELKNSLKKRQENSQLDLQPLHKRQK